MGVFSRFMDIINSNINAILDNAEDPEKMVKLMINEMEDTIIEIKTNCAASIGEHRKAQGCGTPGTGRPLAEEG